MSERVAVVFGGRSPEHEVSCRSAESIIAALSPRRYEVLPVHIGRDGVWSPETGDGTPAGSILATMRRLAGYDVVLPALHGPYGEDGTIQALLEDFGIPYVGNGVVASALSMDKEYTKKIAVAAGLAVADGVVLRRGRPVTAVPDPPVFVKPARGGSSIGVSRVEDRADLPAALARAFAVDDKVLVEAAVPGREVDIGVLEHPDGHLAVSPPLEIRSAGAFFDYDAKYADPATVFAVPDLDPAALARDALRLFRELGCSGLLRVDFFLRPDGGHVLNEVNTFPGFTAVSQYPRMWRAAGLSYADLLDTLIRTALR